MTGTIRETPMFRVECSECGYRSDAILSRKAAEKIVARHEDCQPDNARFRAERDEAIAARHATDRHRRAAEDALDLARGTIADLRAERATEQELAATMGRLATTPPATEAHDDDYLTNWRARHEMVAARTASLQEQLEKARAELDAVRTEADADADRRDRKVRSYIVRIRSLQRERDARRDERDQALTHLESTRELVVATRGVPALHPHLTEDEALALTEGAIVMDPEGRAWRKGGLAVWSTPHRPGLTTAGLHRRHSPLALLHPVSDERTAP